jgi:hypothetical protein
VYIYVCVCKTGEEERGGELRRAEERGGELRRAEDRRARQDTCSHSAHVHIVHNSTWNQDP